jgi:hypothetical protein
MEPAMRALFLSFLLSFVMFSAHAEDTHKVVYHITAGIDSTSGALYNVQNHLNADPKIKMIFWYLTPKTAKAANSLAW